MRKENGSVVHTVVLYQILHFRHLQLQLLDTGGLIREGKRAIILTRKLLSVHSVVRLHTHDEKSSMHRFYLYVNIVNVQYLACPEIPIVVINCELTARRVRPHSHTTFFDDPKLVESYPVGLTYRLGL